MVKNQTVTFADIIHESLVFFENDSSHKLVLSLIDNPWIQRLRDISQTANTRLVYMFSEHSRFGHSLGVCYLADQLLKKLSRNFKERVEEYRTPILIAALLHDIGHLAPGSHTAFKSWFPNDKDAHEEISSKIIQEDSSIYSLLSSFNPKLPLQVIDILNADSKLPKWTWKILSGNGWNVDRGSWCIADSILAGVSYGKYNISALTDSILITEDGDLGILENRLDAMLHFAVSREAMYRQIYQHRVLLSADVINALLVKRLREVSLDGIFVDDTMCNVLLAKNYTELGLDTIFEMRESWWRYHLMRWLKVKDPIIADLSNRLINRNLFKTIRVDDKDQEKTVYKQALKECETLGFDPKYYLHSISTVDTFKNETQDQIKVYCDTGEIKYLSELDPLFNSLTQSAKKSWIVMPDEVKRKLRIER